eukprot:COSAG04_NODE_2002_length_5029_cov_5.314604_1_plen_51_part_10
MCFTPSSRAAIATCPRQSSRSVRLMCPEPTEVSKKWLKGVVGAEGSTVKCA